MRLHRFGTGISIVLALFAGRQLERTRAVGQTRGPRARSGRNFALLRQALVCAALFALIPCAQAQAHTWRPSCAETRRAATIVLGQLPAAMDGRLVLGPCARRGTATQVTRARIVGPTPLRFRVLVSGAGDSVVVRVRVLP